jgi:NhaP-type Na+/H+ and K+/H+ antiporter
VILFDSGFGAKLSSLKAAATPAIVLATLGVLLTTGLVGVAAHLTFGFPWFGSLAAYVAGIVAGNSQITAKVTLLRFQAGFTWLAQISMFLILGLLATPSEFATSRFRRLA